MELTRKEKLAWGLYSLGSLCVVLSTNAISGQWQAIAAFGTSLITAAAGLGIQGLRATQGGRT
jgi:hypothetical protein